MGLPISLFALMMVSVICSLLIIIFSFNLSVIVTLLLFNALLYGALDRWVNKPDMFHIHEVFPRSINNKRIGPLSHE